MDQPSREFGILRTILEKTPNHILYHDLEGRIRFVTPALARVYGMTPERMIGRTWRELGLPRETFELLDAAIEKVTVSGTELKGEAASPLTGRYYEYTIQPTLSGRGEVEGTITTIVDITEHKRADESLRLSEEKFAKAFYGNTAAMVLTRVDDGRIVDANDAWLSANGFTRDEVSGKSILDLNVWAHPDRRKDFIRDIMQQGLVRGREIEFVDRNGRRVIILMSGQIINIGGDRLMLSSALDITKEREAEEAIMKSETLLRVVVSNLPAVLWTTDANGIFTMSEGKGLRALGLRPGEVVGRSAFEVYRDNPTVIRGMEQALAGTENTWRADIGGIVFQACVAPLKDERGNVTGVLGEAIDITELVEAKKAVEKEQARLRAILDTLPVGIAIMDRSGRIVEVNRQIIDIWGEKVPGSVGELESFHGWKARTEEQIKGGDWTISRALQGETIINEEIDIPRPDGKRTTILASGAPIRDRDGESIGALTTVIDITGRKELEKDLEEAKSRAELYLELLTHDITNYNTAAMGYLELAQMRLSLDEKHRKLITRPLQVLRNSSELIANVRDLQRVETGQDRMGTIDLCRMLREVREAFENPPGKDVEIVLDIEDRCSIVASGLLRDAIANIVNNAIIHSPGPVTVRMSLRLGTWNGKDVIMISVEDNGPGIPDDRKELIFDRAIMGLNKGVSRGLGLYLVRRLMEEQGGEVWVEDRIPGDHTQGARFVMVLPMMPAKAESSPGRTAAPRPAGRV